jgi:hypothetical protein
MICDRNSGNDAIHQTVIGACEKKTSHLVAAHVVQLGQDGQAGVHPSLNAVLCTCFFGLVEGARGDLAGDALLPADFVQVVDSWDVLVVVCGLCFDDDWRLSIKDRAIV